METQTIHIVGLVRHTRREKGLLGQHGCGQGNRDRTVLKPPSLLREDGRKLGL